MFLIPSCERTQLTLDGCENKFYVHLSTHAHSAHLTTMVPWAMHANPKNIWKSKTSFNPIQRKSKKENKFKIYINGRL